MPAGEFGDFEKVEGFGDAPPSGAPHGGVLRLRAPAKLNLGLSVVAKRGDGFHELDTLMATLELADTLWLEPRAEGVQLEVDAPAAPGFEAGVPSGADNLVWRAAEAYLAARRERGAAAGGVRLRLRKRVPVAAGLGGGSSDAAAALLGLARLYPAPGGLEEGELEALALRLGSDVPFFVRRVAAARVRGRGERIEPLAPPRLPLPPLPLVLVNPGVPVSAAEAYRALQNFSPRLQLEPLLERLRAGEEPRWPNALQPGVMLAHPAVREALGALRDAGLRGALMSGSGATCFALADSAAEAERVAAELAAARPRWFVAATRLEGAGG